MKVKNISFEIFPKGKWKSDRIAAEKGKYKLKEEKQGEDLND